MKRRIEKEFVDANILKASVEHNGFQGGDAGHGGYVKINFTNLAGTDMFCNGLKTNGFSLEFKGDAERRTLVEALKMIVTELIIETELTDQIKDETNEVAQILYDAIWSNRNIQSQSLLNKFIDAINSKQFIINELDFYSLFDFEPECIRLFASKVLYIIKHDKINVNEMHYSLENLRKQLV